jgi:hypothetical protein
MEKNSSRLLACGTKGDINLERLPNSINRKCFGECLKRGWQLDKEEQICLIDCYNKNNKVSSIKTLLI